MSTTVVRWRIYCETQGEWVYNWGDAPVACLVNTGHTVNLDSVQQVNSIGSTDVSVTNFTQTAFQDTVTVSKNPLIDLKSFFGVSALRNKVTTVSSGTASASDAEIILATTSSSTSSVQLESVERGEYLSGTICEVGVAVRIPTLPTGTQEMRWGYYDSVCGFYFKLTSTGFSCCSRRDSTETSVARQDFNLNLLDGSESNGVTLDFAKGNIFKIQFSWYGYGLVKFGMVCIDSTGAQKTLFFHQYQTYGNTSTNTPNLPITVQLSNNGQASAANMYVAGRQFSMYGKSSNEPRKNGIVVVQQSVTTTPVHIFTLKKKSGFASCKSKLKSIRLKSTQAVIIQVLLNASVTEPAAPNGFGDIEYATESSLTILQPPVTVTYSGGHAVYTDYLFADIVLTLDIDIEIADQITLTCKSVSTGGTVYLSAQVEEFW